MKLLKTPALLELLENYQRAKKVFIVADSVQDEVSSNILFRVGDQTLKPQDYLNVFSKYVKDNPDQVEAIKILLSKPKEWKTKALVDLQKTLQQHQFDEDKLQKAHQVVYHVALADIISMVKHAAKAQEPLLTREERAAKAVQVVSKGMMLNTEQQQWLDKIQEHLAKNLTFEVEDFEEFPIFNRYGGLARAKAVFGDKLNNLVTKINEAVAA
jgi:type I restriction enzyme R subunit